jgi:hypothetical protein
MRLRDLWICGADILDIFERERCTFWCFAKKLSRAAAIVQTAPPFVSNFPFAFAFENSWMRVSAAV